MTTSKWVIDPSHSEIRFNVKHMMISTVTGQFRHFDASIETTFDDFSSAKIDFSADISSISTNNDQRDQHLKTGDFFDAEHFPKIIFKGESMQKISDTDYQLNGMISIRGVTKKISLDVTFGGIITDPYGNLRSGFSIKGKINRKDFGVSFSLVSETGGILLGDEVNLSIETEFINTGNLKAA